MRGLDEFERQVFIRIKNQYNSHERPTREELEAGLRLVNRGLVILNPYCRYLISVTSLGLIVEYADRYVKGLVE
jgi:hypothetical protein